MKKGAYYDDDRDSSHMPFDGKIECDSDSWSIKDLTLTNRCNDEDEENTIEIVCPILTVADVEQALVPLKLHRKRFRRRTSSSNNDESTNSSMQTVPSPTDCCRLLRSGTSKRSFLPLARRGRPHHSARSHRSLCHNCTEIKRQQEIDLRQQQQQPMDNDASNSGNIFDTIIDLDKKSEIKIDNEFDRREMTMKDVPHELEFSLKGDRAMIDSNENNQYEPVQTLVWKMNPSHDNSSTNRVHVTYDTGSLTDAEKRVLLDEAIRNLRIVLDTRSSPPSTTVPDSDAASVEFTFRALQTTVDILTSSYNLL